MGFEFDAPEEVDSPYLRSKGIFHFLVMDLDPNPMSQDNVALPGIRVTLGVLDGTDKTQINKQWETTLYRGTERDTDKNRAMNNRRLDAFFEAVGIQKQIVNVDGKKRVQIDDPKIAIHRQFIGETAPWTDTSGKRKMGWEYANIYHVDDPRVAAVPKSADGLKLIPAELRRAASSFTPAGVSASGSTVTQQAAPPAAAKVTPMQLLQGSAGSGSAPKVNAADI